MTNRRLNQAIRRVLSAAKNFVQRTTKAFVLWVLKGLLLYGRQPVARKSGFVLPTTVLLLLVLTLTVGAITLRTYSRTEQAIGERSQRVIYNAATPAIDRAKAKLEYLFNRQLDPRLPSGIPAEAQLWGMMVNDGEERDGLTVPIHLIDPDDPDDPDVPNNEVDPYTFPDETRLDLDGDGLLDNAWSYPTDIDGNEEATVAYSILSGTPADPADMQLASDDAIADRANALQVRHGPLSATTELNAACVTDGDASAAPVEAGWFTDQGNSSVLRKNFQVDAYILPDDANGTVATVEFHQDRQLAKGNKWGAWFRNDLEIFAGPTFNWNGAMHTEGNLVIGDDSFTGFLVSSPASCLYTREASEVTVTDIIADPDNDIPAFQAQIMSGTIKDNSFSGDSKFHLFGNPPIRAGDNNIRLDSGRDSVAGNNPRPAQYALDPIALVTRDVSVARDVADPSTERAGDWINRKFVTEGRIYNQAEDAPYLDDFYRADNRYGPKPRVSKRQIPGAPEEVGIGRPITGDLMAADNISDDALINLDASEPSDVGLDGYWERRATIEGMKLIVGQRLELGDAFGWGLDLNQNGVLDDDDRQAEPLYPANVDACTGNGRCHETLQRKTLYDNLAAVQSLAVYHSSHENEGGFPAACMAFTAHPGTAETIKTSRTFENVLDSDGNPIGLTDSRPPIDTDFLNGKGTNGWEFNAPGNISGANAETEFAAAIASTQPLGIALRNLAHFAGDPQGGAPSFTPVQEDGGDIVHPYPNLTMWGDYSMLRRVLAMVDGGTAAQGNPTGETVAYADLSPADKATLHTAACSLGMLAHNLATDQEYYESLAGSTLTNLGEALWQLVDGNSGNREVNELISPPVPFPPGYDRDTDAADFYAQFTTDQFVEALINKPGLGINEEDLIEYARAITSGNQIKRDRILGFVDGGYLVEPESGSSIDWDPNTGLTEEVGSGPRAAIFKTGCDPDIFDDSAINGGGGGLDPKKVGLALGFCAETNSPKYPALYYLFPVYEHDHEGGRLAAADLIPDDDQSGLGEEYIDDDDYIFGGENVNGNYLYTVVGDDDGDGIDERQLDGSGEESIVGSGIALTPHALDFTDWVLPVDASPSSTDPNLIYDYDSDRIASVSLLDKGIYNGRELMGTRVLDIDWEILHNATDSLGNDANGNIDHWLPNSGIVYAFREDAVREDGIVRPRNADWDACDENATYERTNGPNNGRCRMKADPGDLQDPPLNAANAISPKAVDYYPDPDRRPNGFRLFNGAKLNRNDDNGHGMTFVADAPVYIKGDFNLHQTTTCNGANGCRLEEFQTKLQDSFNNFYNRNDLDIRFARPTTDLWRPSEILADAVSVVSENWCDGSIEDFFVTAGNRTGARINDSNARYGCSGNDNRTTYLNATRPNTDIYDDDFTWFRADPNDNIENDENEKLSPILLSRNGNPLILDTDNPENGPEGYSNEYDSGAFDAKYDNANKPMNDGLEDTRVNAIIISGLTPSRSNQSYGGMHNFPRFIENWRNRNLYISGALLQLNFSNYATAPFEQDAWETDSNARPGREWIGYYSPPKRLWGYDVGLQYAPAGPIAERFVTPQTTRSEFYSEPPADDQYMVNLCRKIADDAQCGA